MLQKNEYYIATYKTEIMSDFTVILCSACIAIIAIATFFSPFLSLIPRYSTKHMPIPHYFYGTQEGSLVAIKVPQDIRNLGTLNTWLANQGIRTWFTSGGKYVAVTINGELSTVYVSALMFSKGHLSNNVPSFLSTRVSSPEAMIIGDLVFKSYTRVQSP
jgi:hypothetical protein